MKKLLIAAITFAMCFAGSAALTTTPCPNCGERTVESGCDVVVFKVTGSGKTVVSKNGYKTVKALKIKKGALALTGSYCATTGNCCYDSGMFYATIKAGKSTYKIATEIAPTVWSVFGENYERVELKQCKPGKKYKLNSALCIESQGDTLILDGDNDVEDISFAATGFGKIIAQFPKASKKSKSSSPCSVSTGPSPCEPIVTPKNYSGWFVGKMACLGEEGCFLCDCADTDVFGGTWKAVYMEKITTNAGAMNLAGVKLDLDEE